ncbi:MAG TPA: 50S ribosomal protein L21 [Patescibacteria group bacterium]|nr:50S ribosomal protein L21 [Patescibacteria group bacterium]
MKAVIATGGKQYIVSAGTKIQVEKLEGEVGQTVKFDQVLFAGADGTFEVGKPTISGKIVEAKVLKHGKGKKIHVLKYKNKSKYRRKIGHRQQFTEVEITTI